MNQVAACDAIRRPLCIKIFLPFGSMFSNVTRTTICKASEVTRSVHISHDERKTWRSPGSYVKRASRQNALTDGRHSRHRELASDPIIGRFLTPYRDFLRIRMCVHRDPYLRRPCDPLKRRDWAASDNLPSGLFVRHCSRTTLTAASLACAPDQLSVWSVQVSAATLATVHFLASSSIQDFASAR